MFLAFMIVNKYLPHLVGALLLKAVLVFFLIAFYSIHLSPDEAQYWTWSQALDWGYYSKPPMIAWQIALTTSLFGNTEWGIRSGAVILSFILSFVVYRLATKLEYSSKVGLWAALMMAFCPLGIFFSFAATTDVGMTLFFALAALSVVKNPNYLITGLWVLLGALYKWTAFIFWPIVLIFAIFYPHLRKKSLVGGIIISLLALLPSLYWNASHEWATFKHVFKTVTVATGKSGGNFFDFLAAQIGLLSPVFFFFWIFALISFFKKPSKHPFGLIFSLGISLGVFAYLFLALFNKIQPNWAAFLYPPAFLGISLVMIHRGFWRWFGLALSILGLAFAILIPTFQTQRLFSIPYKLNPFRQSMGWENLPEALSKAGYNPKSDFLFSDKYQGASLLSFYSEGKKRAYFFNIGGTRKNQFSYFPQMGRERGNDGFFVVLENAPKESSSWYEEHYTIALKPYFDKVTLIEAYPLFEANGKGEKYAFIFKGTHYNGKMPVSQEMY